MSYIALYRRHRPIVFDEVVGQEHIVKTLKNQIVSNRVGHAYLLNGTRGTGKTSTAKILARSINCLNPKDGNPCNECDICLAALNGSLTDIVEMDAASNNSVDDVRAIRDEVNFLPTIAKYRVYIIDEVHMLSIGAFNALLKTLEEPPEHVKFILATTEPQKLPTTILSRCQRFDFKKIPNSYIKSRIVAICEKDNIQIDEDAINTISIFADGAMRDALSILERCLQEGLDKITNDQVKELVGVPKLEHIYNLVKSILEYNVNNSMQVTDNILNDGKDVQNFTWEIIKYVKDILVFKTIGKIDLYSENEIKQIEELANLVSKDRLLNIIFTLSNLSNDLKFTNQTTIMFQVNIMKLCDKNYSCQSNNQLGNDNLIGNVEDIKNKGKNSLENALEDNIEKNVGNNALYHVNLKDNVDFKNVNTKILNIENVLKKLINNQKNILMNNENDNNKNNSVVRSKVSSYNMNIKNLMTTQTEGKNVECWGKIVGSLKESGKVMLYSNLANSSAIELNDMTIGIRFSEGLNPFGQSVVGKSENISEISKMLSMEYGKPMQIKIIDNLSGKSDENSLDSLMRELDLPLNIIE